jgi:hypothetical protein
MTRPALTVLVTFADVEKLYQEVSDASTNDFTNGSGTAIQRRG